MQNNDNTSSQLLLEVGILEQIEAYDEGLAKMLAAATKNNLTLSLEECKLFEVIAKNAIEPFRSRLSTLTSLEQKCESKSDAGGLQFVKECSKIIETKLQDVANKIVHAVDSQLKLDLTNELKVNYYKLKGDYYGYQVKAIKALSNSTELLEKGLAAYNKAQEIAEKALQPADPLRLGVALNFSVFYYEILNDQKKACELAKDAYDKAIVKLEYLDNEHHRESTIVIQLLGENLNLWASTDAEEYSENI